MCLYYVDEKAGGGHNFNLHNHWGKRTNVMCSLTQNYTYYMQSCTHTRTRVTFGGLEVGLKLEPRTLSKDQSSLHPQISTSSNSNSDPFYDPTCIESPLDFWVMHVQWHATILASKGLRTSRLVMSCHVRRDSWLPPYRAPQLDHHWCFWYKLWTRTFNIHNHNKHQWFLCHLWLIALQMQAFHFFMPLELLWGFNLDHHINNFQLLQPIQSILSCFFKGDWINPSLENFQFVWSLAEGE